MADLYLHPQRYCRSCRAQLMWVYELRKH